MRELEPDVVAVQELAPDQAEALAAVLPHGRLEPNAASCDGLGIALARPGRVEPLPLAYRAGWRVALDPADWPALQHPLEIVNVHVLAPHARRGTGLLRRPRQMNDLMSHIAEPPRGGRVVVGDFNASPVWPVYRRMRRHLTDAAVAVARREGRRAKRTWGPWHGAPRLLRIDHGFVQRVEPQSFEVVTSPGSDHDVIVLDVAPPTS